MKCPEGVNEDIFSNSNLQALTGRNRRDIDPFALVKDELESVSARLRNTVLTEIPKLGQAADYFFQLGSEGKPSSSGPVLLYAACFAYFDSKIQI